MHKLLDPKIVNPENDPDKAKAIEKTNKMLEALIKGDQTEALRLLKEMKPK